jgi:hypothetical protein
MRNYTFTLSQMNSWNYGGLDTYHDIAAQFTTQFNNRWDVSLIETYIPSELATRLLRGGPALRLNPYWKHSLLFNTNKSKRVAFILQNTGLASTDGITRQYMVQPGVTFRVGNHVYIKTDLAYTHNRDNLIYVTQKEVDQNIQYVMGRINQETYNFTLRLNYNITPDISIQYYGSPFISNGSYSDFKRADDTHSKNESERYHVFTESEIAYDNVTNTYHVTEGTNNYSFANPDFSFREFRSNLVGRWEYRPGSTIYLVWEHNRRSADNIYYSSVSHNLDDLFAVMPTNVFMVKMSFWLGL